MKSNRRVANLFAAGTLVSMLAFTGFLFDSSRLPSVLAAQLSSLSTMVEGSGAESGSASGSNESTVVLPDVAILQAENDALRTTIDTMQARETTFQAAIETANQTIKHLEGSASTQLADANSATATLEQRNQELQHAVQLLQDRDGQYRTQIEGANETIRGLEGAIQQRQTAIQTLQSQNAELIQAVKVMQERERQYQAQLQAATEALQSGGNNAQANNGGGYQENTGNYEHEEYEGHEEHEEHEEHDDD